MLNVPFLKILDEIVQSLALQNTSNKQFQREERLLNKRLDLVSK